MTSARAQRLRREGARLPEALVDPDPSRLAPGTPGRALVCAEHAAAVRRGEDGYVDPLSHLFVFTAAHHWDKGRCCELGCRHCPWVNADERLSRADVDVSGTRRGRATGT